MNKVILVGNLARDPETQTTSSDVKYTRFTLAVSRRFSKDETDFIPCVCWRQTAELCEKYLSKGSKIGAVGSIQVRSYDKDGEKRYTTEVVVDEIEFLSTKNGAEAMSPTSKTASKVSDLTPVDGDDEDLPF